jgi:hypothetical protein
MRYVTREEIDKDIERICKSEARAPLDGKISRALGWLRKKIAA